ncbi:MAG: PLP-dependent lyase/thiolase, partial [Patescibacteria group bacterium]
MKDNNTKGIWKYDELFSYNVLEKYRVTKNEGNTPLLRLGFLEKETGIQYIYAKREDKNPTGSSKDRSLAFIISYLQSKKIENIAVPSSGNTAISAIAYSKLTGINIDIFISDKLSKEKTTRLDKYIGRNSSNIKVHRSKKPLSDAFKYSKEKNIPLLRGSKDKYAVEGF